MNKISFIVLYIILFSFGCSQKMSSKSVDIDQPKQPTEKSLKNSRPNIIFVMTDDQGMGDLSCMGNTILHTPHIDAFYKKSTRFTNYLVSPTCAPSRAAIMSGQHPFKVGVTHTIWQRERMALDVHTFPQALQSAGYQTGLFGKWHIGDEAAYLPQNRGFNEVLMHGAGGIGQVNLGDFPTNDKDPYFDNVLLHNDKIVQTEGFCTDLFFDAALAWTKEQLDRDQAFFTYLSLNAPHGPFVAPDKYKKRFIEQGYDEKTAGRYGMIENIDDNFGRLMEQLEKWNALENTLVIFTTDNGMSMPKITRNGEQITPFNAGMKGRKNSPYEGGNHVPFFCYWKGKLAEGKDMEQLIAHIDLYPTFVDLVGAKLPKKIQPLEGRSFVSLLENSQSSWKDRELFVHCGRWNKEGRADAKHTKCAVRTQQYRFVNNTELYDIKEDSKERYNVIAKHPDVVAQLSKSYDNWWKESLPLMVNEKLPKIKQENQALYKRYEAQLAKEGIPNWRPNSYEDKPIHKETPSQNIEPTWESMAENYTVPEWFQDGKIGVWMHWGVPSSIDENRPHDGSHYGRWMYGSEEMRPPARNDNQVKAVDRLSKWHIDNYGPLEEFGYEKLIPNFKAENFNAENIVQFAKECGAKFIMPVATHHDNFDMYDSSFPWNSVKMGPKRDIIQEWKDAAYKHGLKFGVSTHLYWSPKFFNSSRRYQTPGTPEWDLFNMEYDPENYASQDSWNEHWYKRCWELIDKYDPDMFNNDSPYPSIKTGNGIGIKLFSNFLNKDLKENNGQQTTVLSFKDTKKDKAAFTYNLERGMFGEIQKHPWMWATDLSGSWFYRKGAFTKMSTPVFLGNAIDAISKNGVVMINLALKGDGTLPDNQAKMLSEFGAFVQTNAEGIYGTRPWEIYGEGPLEIITKRAGENLKEFSAADIRFTTKGDNLYAFVLAPPTEDISITTLKENGLLKKHIKQITLMGSQEKIAWTRNATGVVIKLPKDLPNHPIVGFKIELGLKPQAKVAINSAVYPEFSWDKMPLYMHLRKVEDFSKAELKHLAQFPLITLEKTTGSKTYGGTEKGSIKAAKAIKSVNPKAKILYYRNCIINWPSYQEDEQFIKKNPDALLKDSQGEYALMNNMDTKFFDISKKHVKEYWLNNAIKHANSPYIDGIFIDANYKVLTSFMKHKKVDQATRDGLKTSYYDMMGTLKKEIGEEKLIISNILRVRPEPELENGRALLPYTHGSYIETFENNSFGLSYEDYLAEGIATIQQSAREGNIIALTLGLGEALEFETEGMDDRRKSLNIDEDIKERLDYLLAIFLVCAEKYSYIYPHDGFDVNTRRKTGRSVSKVWMKTFPQYENRLGAPKGPAKQEGYIYTRSFEYLDVWLDIENQKARLDWK